jgi:hypothetical protein
METDTGHRGIAGQIPNINFPNSVPPPPVSISPMPFQAVQPANSTFCTHCGKPVVEKAVACTSCGAAPIGHKNFCRSCGVALNPHQIVCVKCGAATDNAGQGSSISSQHVSGKKHKNRTDAALFAIFLGGLGFH